MAKPTAKPITLVELNTRLVNSRSGITGSAARRSTAMKPTTQTTARTPSPMICTEPQP
jgi:hypothetical protein